jgi:hypothetical protein
MPRLTITEIAAAVGVHKSTVSRQVRARGIVGADGKVDLEEYKQLREGLDPGMQTTSREAATVLPRQVLADARNRKIEAEAATKELALAKLRGELIDTRSVDAAGAMVFGRAIAAFLDMWSPLSVRLAQMTDPGAIAEAGTAATKQVMARLHQEFMDDAARRAAEAG